VANGSPMPSASIRDGATHGERVAFHTTAENNLGWMAAASPLIAKGGLGRRYD